MWVKQTEDTRLPDWLKENLRHKCDCGFEMENFYNQFDEITGRRCSNPKCIYREAERVADMCDILQVKGIKAKTGLKMLKENRLTSHFEVIPLLFKEKPTITIYNLLRITFIRGVSGQWAGVANQCDTLDDLFSKYKGQYADLLNENKEEILFGAKFFNIQEKIKFDFDPLVTGTVMISGNLRGLNNRNSFIYGINQASRGLIQLSVAEGKRKTGVMALIQEEDTPNRGKAECAIENGIPIMTPAEFQTYVAGQLQKKLKDKGLRS